MPGLGKLASKSLSTDHILDVLCALERKIHPLPGLYPRPPGLKLSSLPSPAAHKTAEMLRLWLPGFKLNLLYSANPSVLLACGVHCTGVGVQGSLAQEVHGAQSCASPTGWMRFPREGLELLSGHCPRPWAATKWQEEVLRPRHGPKATLAQGTIQDKALGKSLAGEVHWSKL